MASITMTSVDPGEGSPLQNGTYLAVYGGTSLLDIFYPVGTYYETSNTDFDPNVTWGGVWELDSQGRVTVSQDSGTFSTIGATGGNKQTDLSDAIHYGSSSFGLQNGSTSYNDRVIVGVGSRSGGEAKYTPLANVDILQPYIVVKRWHRVS